MIAPLRKGMRYALVQGRDGEVCVCDCRSGGHGGAIIRHRNEGGEYKTVGVKVGSKVQRVKERVRRSSRNWWWGPALAGESVCIAKD